MINSIIGGDEVGYGSLAGSLIVCAVRAPFGWGIDGLEDSKKLSAPQRQNLRNILLQEEKKGYIQFHIAERTHTQIDEKGVYNVLKEAHMEAVSALYKPEDHIIVDGNLNFSDLNKLDLPIQSMVKADTKIPQCMAASIIAKTTRDAMMIELAEQYPQYGWESNKGYYDKHHILALEKYGITECHRMSYAPMKHMKKPC